MMLTKVQRAELAKKLAYPYGEPVRLVCDGKVITLCVVRDSGPGIRYRVMTYVDGRFEGEWCKGETPEAKFLRKTVTPLISAAKRKDAVKRMGIRWVASQSIYNAKVALWHPYWSSGKAAIAHLCKVCESVEIAPPEKAA